MVELDPESADVPTGTTVVDADVDDELEASNLALALDSLDKLDLISDPDSRYVVPVRALLNLVCDLKSGSEDKPSSVVVVCIESEVCIQARP